MSKKQQWYKEKNAQVTNHRHRKKKQKTELAQRKKCIRNDTYTQKYAITANIHSKGYLRNNPQTNSDVNAQETKQGTEKKMPHIQDWYRENPK